MSSVNSEKVNEKSSEPANAKSGASASASANAESGAAVASGTAAAAAAPAPLVRRYEVEGVKLWRFPFPREQFDQGALGALGASYPAGPVVFLRAQHPDVPSLYGKQFHHERLPPKGPAGEAKVAAGDFLGELRRAVAALPVGLASEEIEISRWRMTECDDMYPAFVSLGSLVYSATDKEVSRLAAAGLHIDYERNVEAPGWALKTAEQLASGIPPAAAASVAETSRLIREAAQSAALSAASAEAESAASPK